MASDDESQSLDHHHEEKDWEAQKENFRICYIDRNMTRKEAAQFMKDHFNFNATPRQWERKIKQWGFAKYSSRDERLMQIAQTGRSVYDVSRPGRRPRADNLHPHEDRNLRRFARREVSRSRSRSRSTSFADKSPPRFTQEFSDSMANAVIDRTFNLNLSRPEMLLPPNNTGFNVAATPAAEDSEQPIQLHYLHESDPAAFGEPNEPDLVLSVSNGEWPQDQLTDVSEQQYNVAGDQTQFPTFSDNLVASHASQGSGIPNSTIPFPLNGNTASLGYPISNPAVTMARGFPQYNLPTDGMRMDQAAVPENTMAEQTMFDNSMQMTQGAPSLNQDSFETNPIFTFELVDADSTPMLPLSDEPTFPSIPRIAGAVPESAMTNDGPLQNDVLPLVEEYTRAVQAAAAWCLGKSQYGEGVSEKLAASLAQPRKPLTSSFRFIPIVSDCSEGQAFMANLAVVLENFANTQQRSLQSMKDTCSILRQKNAVLEGMLNSGKSERD